MHLLFSPQNVFFCALIMSAKDASSVFHLGQMLYRAQIVLSNGIFVTVLGNTERINHLPVEAD